MTRADCSLHQEVNPTSQRPRDGRVHNSPPATTVNRLQRRPMCRVLQVNPIPAQPLMYGECYKLDDRDSYYTATLRVQRMIKNMMGLSGGCAR